MRFWKNTNDDDGVEERMNSSSSSRTSSSSSSPSSPEPNPFAHGAEDGLYRKHQGQILYDTDKRAKPHRCNDRLEDVVRAFYAGGNVFLTVPKVWGTFVECLRSKEGEEPDVPYMYHVPARLSKKENEKEE